MFAAVFLLAMGAFDTGTSRSLRCEIITDTPSTPAPPDSIIAARLISRATVIVRARAVESDNRASSVTLVSTAGVRFERLEVIKGTDSLPHFFTVDDASLTDHDDFNPQPVPYTVVRPSGLRGTCYATAYRQGAEYLLLMTREPDGTLTPYWAPLMPTNEELRDLTDPWLQWVRAHRR
jgi:hypothetical protein